jgi:hypothetical protein
MTAVGWKAVKFPQRVESGEKSSFRLDSGFERIAVIDLNAL